MEVKGLEPQRKVAVVIFAHRTERIFIVGQGGVIQRAPARVALQMKGPRRKLDVHVQLFFAGALPAGRDGAERLREDGTGRETRKSDEGCDPGNPFHGRCVSVRREGAISSTVDQDSSPDTCEWIRGRNVSRRPARERMVAPRPTVAMSQVKTSAAASRASPRPGIHPSRAKGAQIINRAASPTSIAR